MASVDTDGSTPPPKKAVAKKIKASPARLPKKRPGPKPQRATPVRGTPRKYDWEAVGKAYVEGIRKDDGSLEWMNLRELADHYAIPYARVREVSARDRWSEQRAGYQIQAAQERKKKRIQKLNENAVDFDEKSYNAAKIGVGLITQRLGEILKESQIRRPIREEAFERLSNGEPVERSELWSAINYREMDGLARAARTFQEMGQRALGTDVQKVDVTGTVEGHVEHVHSVREEMMRDDTERLTAVVEALAQTSPEVHAALGIIMDAEVVDETDEASDTDQLEIEASGSVQQEAEARKA